MQADSQTENKPSQKSLERRELIQDFLEYSTIVALFIVGSFTSKRLSAELEKFDNLSEIEANIYTGVIIFFVLSVTELGFRYKRNRLTKEQTDYKIEARITTVKEEIKQELRAEFMGEIKKVTDENKQLKERLDTAALSTTTPPQN